MRIRWLGNSCVEIFGDRHVVIDPYFEAAPEPGVDFVLVTHEHRDHFDLECFRSIGGRLIAPRIVLDEYRLEGVEAEVGLEVEGVRVLGSWCWRSRESYSYLVQGRVLHAGDSSRFPEVEGVDLVFSACFPDNYDEYLSGFERMRPGVVVPIHFSGDKRENAVELGRRVRSLGIGFKLLKVGEALTI